MNGVHRENLPLVAADLPADHNFLTGTAVQVLIINGIDGRLPALALNDSGHLIILLHLAVDVDFQGAVVGAHPKEGNRLFNAVPVQILELHLLGQLPGERRGILPPLTEHLVNPVVQHQIIVGGLRRGVEVVHRLGKAPGQQRQHRRRQPKFQPFLSHVVLPQSENQ